MYKPLQNPQTINPPRWGVIYDHPDYDEAAAGRMLSGNNFRRFWWAVKQNAINTANIGIIAGTRNITDGGISKEALHAHIKAFIEQGCRSFLIFGEEMYNTLFGKTYTETHAKMRGSFLRHDAFPEATFVPTYHPRVLNGKRFKTAGSQADLSLVFVYDINRWLKAGEEGFKIPEERFNLEPSIADVEEFAHRAVEQDLLLSLDIETTSLRRDRGDIVVLGAAWSEEDAIVIPFLDGTKGPYFRPLEHQIMKEAVDYVLGNCRQLWQNALFDVPFMRYRGFHIPIDKVIHDTMLLHHALSPELPHNLGFISSCYGKTRYWKDDFLKSDFGILRQDQLTMRRYNARDCVVPMQILPGLLKDVEENGGMAAYAENISCIAPAVEQTETGILLDEKELKKLKKKLIKKKSWAEGILKKLGNLPQEFNLNSTQHLAYFLFQEDQGMLEKLEEMENAFKPQILELWHCDQGHKHWASEGDIPSKPCRYCSSEVYTKSSEQKTKQKQRINKRTNELTGDARKYDELKSICAIRPIVPGKFFGKRNRDTAALVLDKQARASLHGAVIAETLRLQSLKRLSDKHQNDLRKLRKLSLWIRFYDRYQGIQKSLSTYTSFPVWDDGRVHTNILIHGTASGRPASRNPNLLNISKKDMDVRKLFKVPKDMRLVSCDFAAIEARMLAYITGDELFIQAVESGNLHDINTKMLFGIDETHPLWKAGRAAAKIFQFGYINIGCSINRVNCWNAKEAHASKPISSQGLWEHSQGSTTSAWSPERTVKHHERAA